MKFKELVEKALSSITFGQGVREAKYMTPQSYAFHSLSVATLSLEICNAIASVNETGKEQLEGLGKRYGLDVDSLCFYGGFLHDWNKLGSEEEARGVVKKLGIKDAEAFLYNIATMAEGHLPDNLHLPLWISIKLADMLMISDISSVKDVYLHAESPAYKTAVKMLEEYGLSLGYVSSTFRLFTLVASKDLLRELVSSDYFPLISYTDGIVFLKKKGSRPVLLSGIAELLNKKVFSSSEEDVEKKVKEIEECLSNKRDEFLAMNTDVKEVIYKNGKLRQINSFFPTKVCKPFEDVVGNLDNKSRLEVAKRVIEKFKGETPYGVFLYFVHKFSKADEDYIRKGLGIKEKSLKYLEDMKLEDVEAKLDEIIKLLEKRYSPSGGLDKTVQYFVKNSFSGDVVDDLPIMTEKPTDYCVVCGMPIYTKDAVRFVQYAGELKGKAEVWIPREKGLEEIDRVRDTWKVCPICIYEANLMKSDVQPPYFIISFYPGIPVRLLENVDFTPTGVKYSVNKDKSYLEVFKDMGGEITESPKKTIQAYLGSKIVILAKDIADFKLYTRISKTELNKLLPYAPMLSIIFFTSPVMIASSIYEIPSVQGNVVSVSSSYNYTFMKPLKNNLSTLEVLLSYSAKFEALKKVCPKKDEFENCLGYLTNEMDLYSSVDPALGVISIGMGVGTPIEDDNKFFSSFLPVSGYLLKVMGEVSEMEGKKNISSSVFSIANVLREVTKGQVNSKYEVTGFFRDGIDMFFKTSSVLSSKDDRVGIAANAAIASLENKYSLNDSQRARVYSALQDIFERLYEIENEADRSLAISIANTISNWIFIAYKYVSSQGEKS